VKSEIRDCQERGNRSIGVVFSCKPKGKELIDVNGHGVTLIFSSLKIGAGFVTVHGSRIHRIPNRIGGSGVFEE
jgi:hypothetical protein